MVFELNFYDEGHRSYGLFSNVMQKDTKLIMHASEKKAVTFECLQAQIQNKIQSIPYRTAIQSSSNKWLNA